MSQSGSQSAHVILPSLVTLKKSFHGVVQHTMDNIYLGNDPESAKKEKKKEKRKEKRKRKKKEKETTEKDGRIMAQRRRDVRVELAPGSLGIQIEGDFKGCAAVIKRFTLTPAGLESPLASRIKVGDVLVAVNEKSTVTMPFREVQRLLERTQNRRRTLLFRPGVVHAASVHGKGSSVKRDGSADVDIEVRSFRVNRTTSKTFGEFELVVTLRLRGKLGHSVREWSVWKRYSDFALVDAELRKQLGWLMKSIKFPPKKTFGNLQPEFMEKRRLMLDEYISMVVSMKNVADFENHRSSNALRALIEFDKFKNADAQVDKNVVVATEDDNDAAAASSNKAGTVNGFL